MEEIEKTLKAYNWNEESTIRILLNSNNKSMLKEFLPLFRRYTDAIIINYQEGLANRAMISIGKNTISLA
ncbi:hypothetical protein [Cytophaga aurantiaca]|uniref:hypothetical protein n=1 Tax=Cytophaga aurantiaca TaxID=29530 RepID=UPI000362477E|nr:hypothetical protein [Cytophaga aurantiaca]